MRMVAGLMVAASMLPGSAEASTVFRGVLDPVNGWAVLSNDGAPNPSSTLAPGKRMTVSFSIDHGVIAEVLSTLQYRWSYDIIPSDPDAAPFGNDIDGSEACSFNGPGVDGCFDTSLGDPSQPLKPASLITNLIVRQKRLSYDLFRPAGFDTCDKPVLDSVCRSQWTIFNDFRFSIASQKPVGYTLSFSNPGAVPEPADWAMLITGFGAMGATLRRRPITRRRAGHDDVAKSRVHGREQERGTTAARYSRLLALLPALRDRGHRFATESVLTAPHLRIDSRTRRC